jgi:Photosynthesis system II assembly factor YCF48
MRRTLLSVDSDRDRAVDEMLRRSGARQSGATAGAPSGDCLDAETLALWVEDGLSAANRADAERHVADCARCQATLAALVRTASVPERRRPWWQTLRAAWVAPLAAAAAALAIWIAVPNAPPLRPPEPPNPVFESPASPPKPAEQAAAKSPAASTATTKPSVAERREEKALEAPPPSAPAPAAPPPVANARAASAPAATRAFSGIAAADSLERRAPQANVIASEIVSPQPASRWRITGGRTIEHSSDGGATWQEQPTGATSTLTAGSAPSPSICWVVGQDGVVLLSTDGRTWRRVAFPAMTNLVSVRAADERMATVTDVNGRTYVTADGGLQWTQSQ